MTALRPAEARAIADLIGRLEAYRRMNDVEPSPVLETLARLCDMAGQSVIGPLAEAQGERMTLALDVKRVALELSMTPRSVYRLIANGDLPAVKLGGATRVLADDLRAYLDASRLTRREIPTNEQGMETR